MNPSKRVLLWKCLLASMAAHGAAVLLFHYHPLLLHPSFHFALASGRAQSVIDGQAEAKLAKQNQALDNLFEDFSITPTSFDEQYDDQTIIAANLRCPEVEVVELPKSEPLPLASLEEVDPLPPPSPRGVEIAIENAEPALLGVWQSSSIESAKKLGVTFSAIAVEDLAIKQMERLDKEAEFSPPIVFNADPELIEHTARAPSTWEPIAGLEEPSSAAPLASGVITSVDAPDSFSIEASRPEQFLAHAPLPTVGAPKEIAEYRFPVLKPISSWEKDFAVDVHLVESQEKQNGYFFALTLDPRTDLKAHSLQQNFYFLIDRSNSINKNRFEVFKKAVLKAISCLGEDDTFNIYIFDKKIAKFNENNLPASRKSFAAAEKFLQKQEAGTFFASGDLSHMLDSLIPKDISEDEVNTAILLSDGNTMLTSKKQKKALKSWLQQNPARVSLYTAAAGAGNNLMLLSLLSHTSRGKLLYSDTHAALPRKLAKLVLSLRHPIAKDLSLEAIASDPEAQIILFPQEERLPALCSHEPYTVFGFIDQPVDFKIVLHGKSENQWIVCESEVSFDAVKKGSRVLAKKWALLKASVAYETFLSEGDSKYLETAESYLKPYGGESAYE